MSFGRMGSGSPLSVAPSGPSFRSTSSIFGGGDPFGPTVDGVGSNGDGGGGGVDLGAIEDATGSIAGIWSNVKGIFSGDDGRSTPATTQGGHNRQGPASDMDRAKASGKRTLENLWETAKATVNNAIRGGLESAEATSAGGARGAAIGGGAASSMTTVVIAGALILVLLLRR